MGRYRFKKQFSRVGDSVDDLIDDVNDRYESVRDDFRRRADRVRDRATGMRDSAEEAWDRRSDIADDLADEVVSAAECASAYVQARFRQDPVGTIAVAAIGLWVAGKLLKR